MTNANYYELLGVMRTAPPEVILGAYKALAQKYHPEKHPGDAAAAQIIAALNEAARTLLDPARRKTYDEQLGGQAATTPESRASAPSQSSASDEFSLHAATATAPEPPASEPEEPASPPTQAPANWFTGWRLLVFGGAAVVSAKLFGMLGSAVVFGVFYWLQPRRGAWQAIAVSVVAGIVVAFASSAVYHAAFPESEKAALQVQPATQNAAPDLSWLDRMSTIAEPPAQGLKPFHGKLDGETAAHHANEDGPWKDYQSPRQVSPNNPFLDPNYGK